MFGRNKRNNNRYEVAETELFFYVCLPSMLSQVLRTYFSSILFYNASLNSRGFHLYNVTEQTAALQTSY